MKNKRWWVAFCVYGLSLAIAFIGLIMMLMNLTGNENLTMDVHWTVRFVDVLIGFVGGYLTRARICHEAHKS